MSTLVTGGLGIIGSWVARNLVEKGDKPIVYDIAANTDLLADLVDKIGMVLGDILDLTCLIRTIKAYEIKTIVHLAAVYPLPTNPLLEFNVNARGVINVLEVARICDVERVVFTSSKGVYDKAVGEYAHPTYKPITEDYPKTSPQGTYGIAKLASELMGLHYNELFGLDFVALRFSSIYGPGKAAREAFGLYSEMIENAVFGRPTKIAKGGDQKNDVIYVKDVANSIVLACYAENLVHRQIHVGTGIALSLRERAKVVKDMFPDAQIEIGSGTNTLRPMIFDITRA